MSSSKIGLYAGEKHPMFGKPRAVGAGKPSHASGPWEPEKNRSY